MSSNTNAGWNTNWNQISILGSAARNSVGQVNVTRKSRALQQHPNAVRINTLILWWDVHVSRDARGNNLVLLELSAHGALQKLENRRSMRMLLSNVCTDGVQRPAGHNHSPKRMKRTVALDHLLGEPKTVIQELFELVRVNGDRGGLDDWRELYRLARTDERLRGRIHRMIQTIPTPLPHFWLAALASLGEQIDWNALLLDYFDSTAI